MKIGHLCLNWKVLAGFAAVGLGIWAVAPNLVGAALPLLLLAACPLSMLLMTRGMQAGRCAAQPEQTRSAGGVGLSQEEQIAELKGRLAGVQAQHAAISLAIARIEAADPPVVREAEAVARAAGERV
jgi:hypothetical protein